MLVHSKKYPQIILNWEGNDYQFRDGLCDLPDDIALNVTQSRATEYELVKQEGQDMAYLKFNPATWQKDYKKLIWDGPIGYNNGYGNASMQFIEGLDKLADLYVINSKWIGTNMDHTTENLNRIIKKRPDKVDAFYIKFFPAFEFREKLAERYIGYTMLECSRIPQTWVDLINNNIERCIVPCTHQKQAFIDSGVKRDVEVIPLGLITERYEEKPEKKQDGLYYFGTMGTLTYRKGTDLLVKAFVEGLPKEKYPDARLHIKTLPLRGFGSAWFITKKQYEDDARIDMIVDSMSPSELVHNFVHNLDCFVFPTRGEGFGLPPLEAMACGLPTICTTWSGTGDFIDDEHAYPLGYKMVDVPRGPMGYPPELQAENQQWAEPNYDELVDRMRYLYEHRAEGVKMGKKAAKFVRKNFDISVSSKKLINYLDRKF